MSRHDESCAVAWGEACRLFSLIGGGKGGVWLLSVWQNSYLCR